MRASDDLTTASSGVRRSGAMTGGAETYVKASIRGGFHTESHAADDSAQGSGRFRLVRYFTVSSLVAFLVVTAALFFLEWREMEYFALVQQEQREFVTGLQRDFGVARDEAARSELLLIHEAGHVNLTRVLANALWDSHLAPLLERVGRIPIDRCRAVAGDGEPAPASEAMRRCRAEIGRQIMALAEFRPLESRVRAMSKASTVFKIKVYDLRGLTVYSSEHAQIGEDKRDNEGWQTAARGTPASELTHRDRFSAFERIVENRDLIQSYVPIVSVAGGKVVGVFEIYSDVTPLLERISSAAAKFADLSIADVARIEGDTARRQKAVAANAIALIAIVVGLLVALYLVLLLLVRRGQRIIDDQAMERERSIRREEGWHREKASALAAMADSVSHEIGNPLATIAALAEDAVSRQAQGQACDCRPAAIAEQTRRIAAMTRRMSDFVAARSDDPQLVDINQLVGAVCDFMGFDRHFRNSSIEFTPGLDLPAQWLVPDHLTEALTSLLLFFVRDESELAPAPSRLRVETMVRAAEVVIRIHGQQGAGASAADTGYSHPAMQPVLRRAAAMSARITASDGGFDLALPRDGHAG